VTGWAGNQPKTKMLFVFEMRRKGGKMMLNSFVDLTHDEMLSVDGGGLIRDIGHHVIHLICSIFF
jgi:hypothetical protein